MKKEKSIQIVGILACITDVVCLSIVGRNLYYQGYFLDMFNLRPQDVYGNNVWVLLSWTIPILLIILLLLNIAIVINIGGKKE